MAEDAPRDNARQTGPALEKMYQLLVWLVPVIERFPRSQKFLLGDVLQRTAMGVLAGLLILAPAAAADGLDARSAMDLIDLARLHSRESRDQPLARDTVRRALAWGEQARQSQPADLAPWRVLILAPWRIGQYRPVGGRWQCRHRQLSPGAGFGAAGPG